MGAPVGGSMRTLVLCIGTSISYAGSAVGLMGVVVWPVFGMILLGCLGLGLVLSAGWFAEKGY